MSNLRDFISRLEKDKKLLRIKEEADPNLGIGKILKENQDTAVLFDNVKSSDYRVAGNLLSREKFEHYMGMKCPEMFSQLSKAIGNPTEPEIVTEAPCKEVIEEEVDLSDIPIPTYTSRDMGPYITSAVFITKDPEYGLNASYHRATPITKDRLVARICQRHTYEYMERAGGETDVAICIGLSPSVLLAAAMSVGIGTSELDIANSIEPLELVKCENSDILVPADAEIVMEGRMTMKERHKEGPFLDITGTFDFTREEPTIKIDLITHRKNPIYHALVPSLLEHRFLMGTPREIVMFGGIGKVCSCKDVLLTPGGCSWLDGAVRIEKKKPDDGVKALKAAFSAHTSMKHCVVVDSDIDICNPEEVEWAVATRFQGEEGRILRKREKGSSLDPSAGKDRTTNKIGIDATIPSSSKREDFMRGEIGK